MKQWLIRFCSSTRYPGLKQTGKRIILHLLTNIFILLVVFAIIFIAADVSRHYIKWAVIFTLSVSTAFEIMWEAIYILGEYKASLREQERIHRLNTEHEFEHLKSQVNPHFLFNCFNTLSSLISDDPQNAEEFLNELSKVYRYLLNTNTESITTLQSEINFIESYLRLLKTRHGEALQVQIQVDRSYYPLLLPSLSLQLLVENAVKHNIVSKARPLTIEIFTTPARQLIVNNNLQRKLEKEGSTSIGLNNIRAKYQLLHEDGFQVVAGEKSFMAVLPLIKTKPI